MRGEYRLIHLLNLRSHGPSPRAWGIPRSAKRPVLVTRSIPTCVGNTSGQCASGCTNSVHPHVRGEYATVTCAAISTLRSIPTCVGNTASDLSSATRRTVHPHVRGEYFQYSGDKQGCRGPSPRAWGILLLVRCQLNLARSIPTCVGNTGVSDCNRVRTTVHPHVRGEYSRRQALEASAGGPSPRAWGIPNFCAHEALIPRSIPTCVGNTA